MHRIEIVFFLSFFFCYLKTVAVDRSFFQSNAVARTGFRHEQMGRTLGKDNYSTTTEES